MSQGMAAVGGGPEATVLKVGYLDLTQPDLCGRLAAFESNGFDAVVVGEGSLNYVNDFLTEVATGVAPVSTRTHPPMRPPRYVVAPNFTEAWRDPQPTSRPGCLTATSNALAPARWPPTPQPLTSNPQPPIPGRPDARPAAAPARLPDGSSVPSSEPTPSTRRSVVRWVWVWAGGCGGPAAVVKGGEWLLRVVGVSVSGVAVVHSPPFHRPRINRTNRTRSLRPHAGGPRAMAAAAKRDGSDPWMEVGY